MDVTIEGLLDAETIDFQALTRSCRRGLPKKARPKCWKVIMGFYSLKPCHWPSIEADRLGEFEAILEACGLGHDSVNYVENEFTHSIDIDVPRTMTSLGFFSAAVQDTAGNYPGGVAPRNPQHALRRILICTAMTNKALGYVQGMNEYVAFLLYAFTEGAANNITLSVEADVFFCFQTLLSLLGDDFCRSFDFDAICGLTSTMRLFDNVLRFFDPELFRHLEMLGISAEHYAFRWIMLLFMKEFKIADAMRVWDFLLSFGDEVRNAAFFVGAAMCHQLRDSILSANSISDILPLLHEYPPDGVSAFLRVALRWITKFGFHLLHQLKQLPLDDIQALRSSYGLDSGKSLVQVFQEWVPSLF